MGKRNAMEISACSGAQIPFGLNEVSVCSSLSVEYDPYINF